MPANDPTVNRAIRQQVLPQIGHDGQAAIESATALIIGLGGIGCATASYLASSGLGHLLLCDFDTVDETNLGRQILYGPADVGKSKVSCAAARLHAMNPDIRLTEIPHRLSGDELLDTVGQADIILDGCDNFATRFQVSDACVAAGRTLISGSAIRFEGQHAVFGPDYDISPCYRCLYSDADESLDDCSGNGVFSPLPGTIGILMAGAAMKQIVGIKEHGCWLSLYDEIANEWRKVKIAKRADCPACGEKE